MPQPKRYERKFELTEKGRAWAEAQQPEWMLTEEEENHIYQETREVVGALSNPHTINKYYMRAGAKAQRCKLVEWLAGRRDTGCYWYEDEAGCVVDIFALDENDWQQLRKEVGASND